MKSFFRYFLLAIVVAIFPQPTQAEVANNNPNGPAGDYNSLVTTAGSYDPWTGSASREICDIAVAGAVGAYPLKWTRRMNTRAWTSPDTFGHGGGWSHSYQWELAINHPVPIPSPEPSPHDERPDGVLKYPDGRSVDLDDPGNVSGIPAAEEGPYGTMDRFKDTHANGNYDLLLVDGGVVRFNKLVQDPQHPYCRVTSIFDPYGLETTLDYDGQGRLEYIREPGGPNRRFLQIRYGSHQWLLPTGVVAHIDLIDRVEANDGFGNVTQWVNYVYEQKFFDGKYFLYLTRADYSGGDRAVYDYQPSNRLPLNQFETEQRGFVGIIKTCDDDRFAGPLKRIQYALRPRNSYYGAAYGEIWKEQNTFGQDLSVLEIPQPPISGHPYARREHRGNAVRTFYYDNGVSLSARSDFSQPPEQPNWSNFSVTFISTSKNICHFQDARGYTTDKLREGDFQATTRVTYPTPSPGVERPYVETSYTDLARPHYVASRKDERGNTTTYFRNADHSVESILYPNGTAAGRDYPEFPDSPSEPRDSFTYSPNNFRQIETHTMPNGGTEHFSYDNRGLKQFSWPPATSSDPHPEAHPTKYFYYTWDNSSDRPYRIDRLWYVDDPRGNRTVYNYEYNESGQLTRVTHQEDNTFTESQYNHDGTLAWVKDELGHRTDFEYDEYKRVIKVKKIVNGVPEDTITDYTPPGTAGPFSHTTLSVYHSTSPEERKVDYDYDNNFRRIMMRQAPGSDDVATTWYHYDPVGNLDRIEDPRQKFTTFGYDERNRQTWIWNEELDQTTSVRYDPASSKIREERADGTFRSWDYDSMNRLHHAYDWRTNEDPVPEQTTTYARDSGGRVCYIKDTKEAIYRYFYDSLDRKITATYPIDASGFHRNESWQYDFAGNMDQYTNPAGQVKHLHYDSRNRMDAFWWDNNAGPYVVTTYDAASRVMSVLANSATIGGTGTTALGELSVPDDNSAETKVVFKYDEANRKLWEDQTLAGHPTRRVQNELNRDGLPRNLRIVDPQAMGAEEYYYWPTMEGTSYLVNYDYTWRNQLKSIQGEDWSFDYFYDPSSNRTARTAHYNGSNGPVTSSTNCPMEHYDALNRPTSWEQTGANGPFAYSEYQYDQANREQATRRWEDGQWVGERFTYEPTNQLKTAVYNAQNVFTGTPTNAKRSVVYEYPLNKLNRTSVTETILGGPATVTNYSPNDLNQYQSVGGVNHSYDTNFNLTEAGALTATYNAANQLVSAIYHNPVLGDSHFQFVYDGLGRCVKRTNTGYTTVFVYDNWKPIAEWDEWNGCQAWNVYGPGADEILLRYQEKYGYIRFGQDRHGNVAFLLDNDGAVKEKYTYDAFGRPAITDWDGNMHNYSHYGHRFLFQGRDYIHELGMYDYRNRFYLPELGRFLQTDPKGFDAGDINVFRYCGDDPIDRSDPLGLEIEYHGDRANLEALRAYASGSALARQIIADADRLNVPIFENNQGIVNSNKTGPNRVNWDPRSGLQTKPGNLLQTPALGAIHELDHGVDRILHPKEHSAASKKGTDRQYDTLEDRRVVERERTIIEELKSGEGKRYNHGGARTRTSGPTSRIPTRSSFGNNSDGNGSDSTNARSSSDQTSGPTAAQVDAAHQATGVPSLGQESVNFAPGRP